MGIEDPRLPAVVHLTGAGAVDVLGAAVHAGGGALLDVRVSQIQYRPGQEVVVRYRCDVQWPDGRHRRDTLLAATSSTGPLPGAVPVTAETADGTLEVSVWRWPFDPRLPGLATAVTASHLSDRLRGLGVEVGTGPTELDVVAYRPTERAVVRLGPAGGAVAYVKAVPPSTTEILADRHRWLRAAGLPVPEVLAVDETDGLLVLAELPGATLRDRLKLGLGGWPAPGELAELFERLASVPAEGLPPHGGRLADALHHAELLSAVAPENDHVLARIVDEVGSRIAAADARATKVIHGDLHEAQLIVEDGAVTGLLDVDDVGVGDPVTDMATLVGHLRFRALLDDDGRRAAALTTYAGDLRREFATRTDAHHLDGTVAAVLVGLATGPFRIQRNGWRADVAAVLGDAAALLGAGPPADEELLRTASRPSQHRTAL